jgi:hypothetical protein
VEWARETFEASQVKEATMSNATDLQSYRQRKRDRGYRRLDVWVPAHCWRNLHELKTDFDDDLATVLIRLLRHRRRSRGWKNVREAFLDAVYRSTD